MTWFSNLTRAVGWLCLSILFSLLWFVPPLAADDPGHDAPETSAVDKELQEHLAERGLEVFAESRGDLDGDGLADVVAHVAREKTDADPASEDDGSTAESALVIALANNAHDVAVEVPGGMLCPYCPIGEVGGTRTTPEQSLAIEDQRIEVCESWGQSWFAGACATLVLDEGVLRVERHEEVSGWRRGPSEHVLEFDFTRGTGHRNYVSHPIEAGWPRIERESDFAVLTALPSESKPELDGAIDGDAGWEGATVRRFTGQGFAVGREHLEDDDDAAFQLRTTWREEGLWLAVTVADDTPVHATCPTRGEPIQADHLQLWLDLGDGLRASGNAAWIEEHRRVYLEDPVRHRPDDTLHMFAIAPTLEGEACVREPLPRDTEEAGADLGVQSAVAVDGTTGFTTEVFIPASWFGVESMAALDGRTQGIGTSVVYHDVDDAERPQDNSRIATSTLVWGDPYTLGLLVMPERDPGLPSFPFDWSQWLE